MSNNDEIHLKDILNVVGETGEQCNWKISGVECFGEMARKLHQYSDEAKEIPGEEFYRLVSKVYQVIDGEFETQKINEDDYSLLIRAIDGTEFDIETIDKNLLKRIRSSFKDVQDLVY